MKVTISIKGRITKATHTQTGTFHFDETGEIQPGTPPRVSSPMLLSSFTSSMPFDHTLSYETISESESREAPSLDSMSFSDIDNLSGETVSTPTLSGLTIGCIEIAQLDEFYKACQELIFNIRSFCKNNTLKYSGEFLIEKIANGESMVLLDRKINSVDDVTDVANFIANNVSGTRRARSTPFMHLSV